MIRGARSILLTALLALAQTCGCRATDPQIPIDDEGTFQHDLFVITSGQAGRSYRIRVGDDREPRVLAAESPTFYDGTSLVRFQRMELSRTVALERGGSYEETRVRLTEEDGLGTGRWIHEHGLFGEPPPGVDGGVLTERSGKDLVAVVGALRGIRVWSEGTVTHTSYVIHDRFGDELDLLKLYGPQHRELIEAARQQWEAIPAQQRDGYRFDYKSSYLRPAPGGLHWVMHGTAADEACQGTTLPVEVPAPTPLHGDVDTTSLGQPGDDFRFGSVQIVAGETTRIQGPQWSLELPCGSDEDPPLVAVHWMASADIPAVHEAALDSAFTEVVDLDP